METTIARIRASLGARLAPRAKDPLDLPADCSWEAMRRVYKEQAARGVPEAVKGLELIDQDRWPSDGRPRHR